MDLPFPMSPKLNQQKYDKVKSRYLQIHDNSILKNKINHPNFYKTKKRRNISILKKKDVRELLSNTNNNP